MRHDDDLLVGHAGKGGNGVLGGHILQLRHFEPDAEYDLFAFIEPVSQREAFVLAQCELRNLLQTALGLKLPVAGNAHHIDHHRRAQLDRPGVGIEEARAIAGRMAAPAGDERAVDDDRLALDIAADEIGPCADAHPDRLRRDALRPSGLGAGNGERGRQLDRRSVSRLIARSPIRRPPIVGKHIWEVFDLEPEGLERAGHI